MHVQLLHIIVWLDITIVLLMLTSVKSKFEALNNKMYSHFISLPQVPDYLNNFLHTNIIVKVKLYDDCNWMSPVQSQASLHSLTRLYTIASSMLVNWYWNPLRFKWSVLNNSFSQSRQVGRKKKSIMNFMM
jgi:hypothetical protein